MLHTYSLLLMLLTFNSSRCFLRVIITGNQDSLTLKIIYLDYFEIIQGEMKKNYTLIAMFLFHRSRRFSFQSRKATPLEIPAQVGGRQNGYWRKTSISYRPTFCLFLRHGQQKQLSPGPGAAPISSSTMCKAQQRNSRWKQVATSQKTETEWGKLHKVHSVMKHSITWDSEPRRSSWGSLLSLGLSAFQAHSRVPPCPGLLDSRRGTLCTLSSHTTVRTSGSWNYSLWCTLLPASSSTGNSANDWFMSDQLNWPASQSGEGWQ